MSVAVIASGKDQRDHSQVREIPAYGVKKSLIPCINHQFTQFARCTVRIYATILPFIPHKHAGAAQMYLKVSAVSILNDFIRSNLFSSSPNRALSQYSNPLLKTGGHLSVFRKISLNLNQVVCQ